MELMEGVSGENNSTFKPFVKAKYFETTLNANIQVPKSMDGHYSIKKLLLAVDSQIAILKEYVDQKLLPVNEVNLEI